MAFRASGDKAAFYNGKLIGFQDTLCNDRGRHFFKGCYIEGTVDFVFGSGKSLYGEFSRKKKGFCKTTNYFLKIIMNGFCLISYGLIGFGFNMI